MKPSELMENLQQLCDGDPCIIRSIIRWPGQPENNSADASSAVCCLELALEAAGPWSLQEFLQPLGRWKLMVYWNQRKTAVIFSPLVRVEFDLQFRPGMGGQERSPRRRPINREQQCIDELIDRCLEGLIACYQGDQLGAQRVLAFLRERLDTLPVLSGPRPVPPLRGMQLNPGADSFGGPCRQFVLWLDKAWPKVRLYRDRCDIHGGLWQELSWLAQGGPVPPLGGERVELRELDWQDFEAMHRYSVDPAVVAFMDWGPNTREQTKAHLQQAIYAQNVQPRKVFEFAIILRSQQTFVGTVGLTINNRSHGEASLGYTLCRSHWGRGYATEAARLLLDFSWRSLGLNRVWATCSVENTASIRVLDKLGMHLEGRLRDHRWIRGRWHDSFLYAAVKPMS